MTNWLASIVGVVVVGVIIELLTQNRRMGTFVRSIYGFIVLFVIIAPLPNLLKTDWDMVNAGDLINTGLVENLTQSSRQVQIQQILRSKGYENAIVTVVDHEIYVNLGVTVDATTLTELQKILGKEVIIL